MVPMKLDRFFKILMEFKSGGLIEGLYYTAAVWQTGRNYTTTIERRPFTVTGGIIRK